MLNFKDYESIIQERVAKIKDDNWKWSVKEITEDTVKIQWGYLTDLGEPNDCFSILRREDETCDPGEYWIVARDSFHNLIEGYTVAEQVTKSWQSTIINGIIMLIEDIADYAHERY